jgi:hypothetical protein
MMHPCKRRILMDRKKLLPIIVVSALAIVAAWGVATFRNVSAQTPTPNPATPNTPAQPGGGKGFRGGFNNGTADQDLATALGISVDKLQAAYQTATTKALQQAVSAGLITQQQADQFSARGNGRFFGGFPGLNAKGIDYNALLAEALGITPDKLQAARQQALTTELDAAVKAGRLTQAQADLEKARSALAGDSKFQAGLKSAYQAAVQQAVTDGVITQAQADAILKSGTGQGPMMGRPGMGGFGGFGGFGGPRGFGGRGKGGPGNNPNGVPGNPAAPVTPTATPGAGA